MTKLKKSEITREALIAEGMQQLATQGYHGTGIKQILDAVKVPKGSFYNYFDSKEAFVGVIIEEYNRQSLATFDKFVAQSTLPAMDQLKTIYQFMLAKFADEAGQQGCLIGSIAAEIGNSFTLCQKAMQLGVEDWLNRISRLIEQAQKENSIRMDLPARDIAELLWSTWEGSLIRMKMEGTIQAPEKMINLLLNQILKPGGQ